MAKLRHALEGDAAVFGFAQLKADQFRDRRLWQGAVDDGFEKTKTVVGSQHLGRHHAVFHVVHGVTPFRASV